LPAEYFGEPRNDLEAWEPYCFGREGRRNRRDGHTGSRIACYEPPGQKNRLWLNKVANRNEFNSIVFPLAPIFAIRWWSCR
jgi:hypothetical protein